MFSTFSAPSQAPVFWYKPVMTTDTGKSGSCCYIPLKLSVQVELKAAWTILYLKTSFLQRRPGRLNPSTASVYKMYTNFLYMCVLNFASALGRVRACAAKTQRKNRQRSALYIIFVGTRKLASHSQTTVRGGGGGGVGETC